MMRKTLSLLALPFLTACASSFPAAKLAFSEAEDYRVRKPKEAPDKFREARQLSGHALAERLDPHARVWCASIHIRSSLELAEFAAAEKTIDDCHNVFNDIDWSRRLDGDKVGLALLKGAFLRRRGPSNEHENLDRAIDAYEDARLLAFGRNARGTLDRHYVDALLKKGSPDSTRLAVRICEEHIDRMEPMEPYFKGILKQLKGPGE